MDYRFVELRCSELEHFPKIEHLGSVEPTGSAAEEGTRGGRDWKEDLSDEKRRHFCGEPRRIVDGSKTGNSVICDL